MSWPSHVGATIETMCSLMSCTKKEKVIRFDTFRLWIRPLTDCDVLTGDCVRWAGPGGQAGPDDLHLPADDQVYLPQVRHQRGGQQQHDITNIGLNIGNSRGLQRDVVYLGWPIALVYEPKCGGRGGVAGSQPMSTAVHQEPNKLWTSNSIFNLW